MKGQNDFAALLGRILLAAVFIPSGFSKIMDFSGTVGYIAGEHLPLPALAAAIAILIELGGGLMIIAGWKTRWVALATIVFMIVITPIFHNFWSAPEADKMMQQLNFVKNLGILGGIFLLFAFGPGRFSVDRS